MTIVTCVFARPGCTDWETGLLIEGSLDKELLIDKDGNIVSDAWDVRKRPNTLNMFIGWIFE